MHIFVVWLHIIATTVWLGGMLFIALVLVPLIRGMEPPGSGHRVLSQIVRRFRYVSWAALIVLVLTGIANVAYRQVSWSTFFSGGMLDYTFGQLLYIKLGFVLLALLFSAIHDFAIGPKLASLMEVQETSEDPVPGVRELRRLVSWLARVNLALALAIVAIAVMLVRGIP